MNRTLLRQIFALSIPAIVANVATPLMSMCDLGIAGRLGGADIIGAVAMGGVVFNLLYWLMGFLRMGTSGQTAQSYGAGDVVNQVYILVRSIAIALALGILIVLLQKFVLTGIVAAINPDGTAGESLRRYCRVCIWGAPAVLLTSALTGWFIGMQNSRWPMVVSLISIATNAVLSVMFVFVLGMEIEGIALGTVIAQYLSALLLLLKTPRALLMTKFGHEIFNIRDLKRFFTINLYIFLRTLCMVIVTLWFTRKGAEEGVVILSVNALIMQCFTLFSYFMDGFAYAAEGLCGKYFGARDYGMLRVTWCYLNTIGLTMALIFSASYFMGGDWLFEFLSDDAAVSASARDYRFWAVTVPFAGFLAFIADGVTIGVSMTRLMFLSMLISTFVFFGVLIMGNGSMGNHALWLAFILYLLARGIFLSLFVNKKIPRL